MNAIAKGRYLRISPLKLRKLIHDLNGKKVSEVLYMLKLLPQKAAKMAYKVIFSAQSNFKNLFPENANSELKISAIYVDQAPVFKRMMPRARGRADVLRKQSSHLSVVVTPENQ